jgi:hypothetical protein
LEDHSDRPLFGGKVYLLLTRIYAIITDRDLATVRLLKPCDTTDSCTLPGTAGAKKSKELAFFDPKSDPLERSNPSLL